MKYTSSTFTSQYNGARRAGLNRGAYHFATPNTSSGGRQADFFVTHGGDGKADGHTLPGGLDRELAAADIPVGAIDGRTTYGEEPP